MKRFRLRRILRPVGRANQRLLPLLNFLDDGREAFRPLHLAACVRQRGGNEVWLEIAIQERAHARRQNQRRKKILVQPPPADDIEILGAYRQHTNDAQR